jgi:subtilisin family serine protease
VNAAARRPRRLLLTLRLGEMPEHLPSWISCLRYGVAPAERIDGGPIDRLLRHHGGVLRCARLHCSRTPRAARPGVSGARRFDDIEQLSGVARVLRIEVADDTALPALVDALAQVDRVEQVSPDRLCATPFDAATRTAARHVPMVDEVWRTRELVRLPAALGYEPGLPSVRIGLADTGVAAAHDELGEPRVAAGFDTVDLTHADVGSLELLGDSSGLDELPDDEVGHGTGCAGIVVARGNALPPGGAGASALVPVRVLGAARQGGARVGIGALANIDAGMKRLIDLGVKVINMSFGTPESSLRTGDALPHLEVVRYALARGVLLVAASGNSGLEERYYPAAHDGVIAVGSVDDDLAPSSFSTRGAHVALCAPGRGVWTCALAGLTAVTGTSFAAPFVAATCALLAARAERRAWPLGPELALEVLRSSTRAFSRATDGCGSGVLDAAGALHALDARIDEALDARSEEN